MNCKNVKTVVLFTALLLLMTGCDTHITVSQENAYSAGEFLNEDIYKNYCESPRIEPDSNGDTYEDKQGTVLAEQLYLRSWSNRTYLWYDEIKDEDPAAYSVVDYFDRLKTDAVTHSANPRDKFHFTQNTEAYQKRVTSGEVLGYGFEFNLVSPSVPRQAVVIDVEPDSPADKANIFRSLEIYSIDGALIESGSADILNAGLFPTQNGETHAFVFSDPSDNGSTFTALLTAQEVSVVPVKYQKVITVLANDSTKKVGYVHYSTFGTVIAEEYTYNVFSELATENLDELVLDLRYNGGGYLFLSNQLGFILAGDAQTQGKIFETLTFNDKYPNSDPITNNTLVPALFYKHRIIDFQFDTSQPLPQLNLKRVFILTTEGTCSASESLMNSLRGVDVEVIQIGSTTCGKPYGFYPQENCGTTYFTIQFKGSNDKGFGDYADGFIPSASDNNEDLIKGCVVADDLTKNFGDPEEGMLSAALTYIETGDCPLQDSSKQFAPVATEQRDESTALRDNRSNFLRSLPGKIITPELKPY